MFFRPLPSVTTKRQRCFVLQIPFFSTLQYSILTESLWVLRRVLCHSKTVNINSLYTNLSTIYKSRKSTLGYHHKNFNIFEIPWKTRRLWDQSESRLHYSEFTEYVMKIPGSHKNVTFHHRRTVRGGEGGCSPPKFGATQFFWAARENLGKASFLRRFRVF